MTEKQQLSAIDAFDREFPPGAVAVALGDLVTDPAWRMKYLVHGLDVSTNSTTGTALISCAGTVIWGTRLSGGGLHQDCEEFIPFLRPLMESTKTFLAEKKAAEEKYQREKAEARVAARKRNLANALKALKEG